MSAQKKPANDILYRFGHHLPTIFLAASLLSEIKLIVSIFVQLNLKNELYWFDFRPTYSPSQASNLKESIEIQTYNQFTCMIIHNFNIGMVLKQLLLKPPLFDDSPQQTFQPIQIQSGDGRKFPGSGITVPLFWQGNASGNCGCHLGTRYAHSDDVRRYRYMCYVRISLAVVVS